MSRFILSCTTCATRMPGRDEMSECFIHAPRAGYRAWGVAGPLFWTPGLIRWADIDRLKQRAAEAGLQRLTEVYSPAFPNESAEAALRAVPDRLLLFDAAEKLGCPLVVMTGRPRTEGGLAATLAGIRALLPRIEGRPVRLALEPHYGAQIQFAEDYDTILAEIPTAHVGITLDFGPLSFCRCRLAETDRAVRRPDLQLPR